MSTTDKYIRVRPVGDAQVTNPTTWRPLASWGDRVPNTAYWQKQLKAGRVETFTLAPAADTKKNAKPDTKPDTKADAKDDAKPSTKSDTKGAKA